MNIQMVDLSGQYEKIKVEIDNALISTVRSTAFINGPAVKSFQKNLEKFLSAHRVIPCANGTDALQIAMMALNLRPGDEVIVPAFTYVATAEVIALLGLVPVWVDVDPLTFNLDPQLIERSITEKTKAIVPVHLYGHCADMEKILQIASAHDLYVIEDTAQALGAQYKFTSGVVKFAGTMGDIGCTSFFPSKNLGCYGDGGALMVMKQELGDKIGMIANHGQQKKYHHELVGVNSRLDTLQAAILDIKLAHLKEYNQARIRSAEIYNELLRSIDGITTPFNDPQSTHVYHQYTIKVDGGKRDELKNRLDSEGIPTMIYYPIPMHIQKAYQSVKYPIGTFPIAENLSKIVLSLPMHTELTLEEQEFITDKIKKHLN